MDASNATAKELSHAARKICGEDGFLREPSSFTSDTLGYGAILEGREAAYIIAMLRHRPFQVVRFYVNSKQWWDLVINQVPQNALEGHRR